MSLICWFLVSLGPGVFFVDFGNCGYCDYFVLDLLHCYLMLAMFDVNPRFVVVCILDSLLLYAEFLFVE